MQTEYKVWTYDNFPRPNVKGNSPEQAIHNAKCAQNSAPMVQRVGYREPEDTYHRSHEGWHRS